MVGQDRAGKGARLRSGHCDRRVGGHVASVARADDGAKPINTVLSVTKDACTIQYEFGSIYGAAYAKVRTVKVEPGFHCSVRIQAVAIRGHTLVNGHWATWAWDTAGWTQSTLPFATGAGAHVEMTAYYVNHSTSDSLTVSAF